MQRHRQLVTNLEDIKYIRKLVRDYSFPVSAADYVSLILSIESYGLEETMKSIPIRKMIKKIDVILAENPMIGFFLPLMRLKLGQEPYIRKTLEELIEELSTYITLEFNKEEVKNRLLKCILLEKRRNLVAIALASEYHIYLLNHKIWRKLAEAYMARFALEVLIEKLKSELDNMDLIEKASIIYLAEIGNIIRSKLGIGTIEITDIRNHFFDSIDNALRNETKYIELFAIIPFIYKLAKITKRKDYLYKLYDILSSLDINRLYYDIMEVERQSRKLLYEIGLDEESIEALARPLDEIEVALLEKTIKILTSEMVHIPLIGFTDFVTEYFMLSKRTLKLYLKFKLNFYKMMHIILKYHGILIGAIVFFIGIIVSYIFEHLTVTTAIILTIISLVISGSLWYLDTKKYVIEKYESRCKECINILQERIKYIDYFTEV